MPKLRVLSGEDVLRILNEFVKVRRILPNGSRQSPTVPLHREVDRGTLLAIYRQALRFVAEDQLHARFYKE